MQNSLRHCRNFCPDFILEETFLTCYLIRLKFSFRLPLSLEHDAVRTAVRRAGGARQLPAVLTSLMIRRATEAHVCFRALPKSQGRNGDGERGLVRVSYACAPLKTWPAP